MEIFWVLEKTGRFMENYWFYNGIYATKKGMDLLYSICANILDGELEELHTQIFQFDLIYLNSIKSD